VDSATVAAVIAATRASEKKAELAKAGLVTEPRFYTPVGVQPGVPYPPKWRSEKSESPHIPGDPRLWPNEGQVVEQGPGDRPLEVTNTYDGKTETWFRELTAEEIASPEMASDKLGAAYLREELAVTGAAKYRDGVSAGNVAARKKIAELEKALAAAKADLEAGAALEAHAGKMVETEKAKLAAWIEASGKTEGAIRKAVELLHRKPEAAEYQAPRAHVPPRSAAQGEEYPTQKLPGGGVVVTRP